MANIAKIKNFDIANGKGIRVSVFFSGCNHHCKNCFNQELWDFHIGVPFTKELYESSIKPLITEHIAGLSILGGEPLDPQNIFATFELIRLFSNDFPDKDIWLWTGYKYTKLLEDFSLAPILHSIFDKIDVLIDGPYIEEQKDLSLSFKGSANQTTIYMNAKLSRERLYLND